MLNHGKAIDYNTGRKFSQKAIGIIQTVVNAPTKGVWDGPSVSQVHKFQTGKSQLGTPDGKVGPKTLGAIIGELQWVHRTADASVLKDYHYEMPSTPNQPGAVNPVVEFAQAMSSSFRFEKFRGWDPGLGRTTDRWRAACVFNVVVDLNPLIKSDDLLKYEYRQFIRGGVWSRTTDKPWTTPPNANSAFDIPDRDFVIPGYKKADSGCGFPAGAPAGKGLDVNGWKEDGELRKDKPTRRFGHRQTAVTVDGKYRDLWSGHRYHLSDQPSLTGTWDGRTVEVWIELYFQGFVVEVSEDEEGVVQPVKILKSKSWQCHSQTMTLNNYANAVSVPF